MKESNCVEPKSSPCRILMSDGGFLLRRDITTETLKPIYPEFQCIAPWEPRPPWVGKQHYLFICCDSRLRLFVVSPACGPSLSLSLRAVGSSRWHAFHCDTHSRHPVIKIPAGSIGARLFGRIGIPVSRPLWNPGDQGGSGVETEWNTSCRTPLK